MESIFSQRLRDFINYLIMNHRVYNDSDFCRLIGKNRSQVSEYLSGKRRITENFVHSLLGFFPELNGEFLLNENETEMLSLASEINASWPPAIIEYEDDEPDENSAKEKVGKSESPSKGVSVKDIWKKKPISLSGTAVFNQMLIESMKSQIEQQQSQIEQQQAQINRLISLIEKMQK